MLFNLLLIKYYTFDSITPTLEKKLRFKCLNRFNKIIKLVVSVICLYLLISISTLPLICFISHRAHLQTTWLKFCFQLAFSQWDAQKIIRGLQKREATKVPFLCSEECLQRWCVSSMISTSPLMDKMPQSSLHCGPAPAGWLLSWLSFLRMVKFMLYEFLSLYWIHFPIKFSNNCVIGSCC